MQVHPNLEGGMLLLIYKNFLTLLNYFFESLKTLFPIPQIYNKYFNLYNFWNNNSDNFSMVAIYIWFLYYAINSVPFFI